jgi:hypothetical protein
MQSAATAAPALPMDSKRYLYCHQVYVLTAIKTFNSQTQATAAGADSTTSALGQLGVAH